MCRKLIFILFFAMISFSAKASEIKTIHVVVALCDNWHQRIYPVPLKLGNGDDPDNNLYWGALYGAKTHFRKSKDWFLVKEINNPQENILRRAIFTDANKKNWIVMDAYQGKKIKNSIEDFFEFSSGGKISSVEIEYKDQFFSLPIGGSSNLIIFAGHNGLMDFDIKNEPKQKDKEKRDVMVLACYSKSYFKDKLLKGGANPVLLTNSKMAPEGYVIHAAVNSWIKSEDIIDNAANAYAKYQKISKKAALNIFTK